MARTPSRHEFTPRKAVQMLPVILAFRRQVVTWLAELPVGSPVYIALTMLNGILLLTVDVTRGNDYGLQLANDQDVPPAPSGAGLHS